MTEGALLISFEGGDGSGKSTQMRLLFDRLRRQGYKVAESAEPGGTPIGRQIRRILLNPENHELAPMAELLLMFASRAQAAEEIIRPALQRGGIVLSDRFSDASLAYQGEARGLGFPIVRALHRLALGSLLPDLTICVELDLETSLRRAQMRNIASAVGKETRFDEQSLEFHSRVLAGYRRIASEEPERFKLVDGSGDPADVSARVWAAVEPVLARAAKTAPSL